MVSFDNEIVRKGTGSLKWDALKALYGKEEILPMWVADMDFHNADPIREALHRLIDDQILGYSLPSNQLYESIINWQKKRHNMELTKDDILFSPGVVGALGVCIQAFAEVGEGVMIHDPVYNPFTHVIQSNGRTVILSPLIHDNGRYEMNFDDIESKFKENEVKLFILSNPQNPSGRVWPRDEVEHLTDLCVKYEVILISDEIHSDLLFKDTTCYSPVTLKEEYKKWVVTLHSATKTFNLAGVKLAFFFVLDKKLREKITTIQKRTEQDSVNTFGMVATEAAFSKGEVWLESLMDYLDENRQLIIRFFNEELPDVDYMVPEATYLFWFNASTCNVPNDQLKDAFVDIGEIALNDGCSYGLEGTGWMRLNFASPRSMVEEGLRRIKKTFELA